ncbi:hypothetical protein [Clostridium sp.]|uniref:hypothetical protein n=1 Tax=Clostridium sp. TaxID=1506 RepID=UPI00260D4C7D|nr:hypothetical protein [Clostridium sp.]
MKGLEYILNLYNMQHTELAEKLGIKKQNINLWLRDESRKIPKKYLPTLSEIFGGLDEKYFQKELDDTDKLIIQKEKLKRELKPQIKEYEMQLVLSDNSEEPELEQIPVYEQKELNDIEFEIKKVKVLEEIREGISKLNKDYEVGVIEEIAKLIKYHGTERMFMDTIDAISHYYNILPDWVGDPYSNEFVEEFLKLAEKHEKGEIN